jgi:predicted nucleotide-binding protein
MWRIAMELYHVYILPKQNNDEEIVKLGLSEQDFLARVLRRYQLGQSITLSGKTIDPTNIREIKITRSAQSVEGLLQKARAELDASRVTLPSRHAFYMALNYCEDVTDEFIQGAPGDFVEQQETRNKTPSNKVFVVHGHDSGLKNAVARFIELVSLSAIVLHERPNLGQTVIEKFEKESDVGFVVVLATADDLADSVRQLEKDSAIPKTSLKERARQNVIFELGYFVGKLGRGRLLLIKDEGVELPSDIAGVVYAQRTGWQRELHAALIDAGYSFTSEQSRKAMAVTD